MNLIHVKHQAGKYQSQVSIGRHTLVADADSVSGGDDAGPSPHELLAASLGSCTVITLRMYAERKGWSLEGLEVTVGIREENGTATFLKEVRFPAAMTSEQKTRLLEIAGRCPVHKILSGKIEIVTAVVSS